MKKLRSLWRSKKVGTFLEDVKVSRADDIPAIAYFSITNPWRGDPNPNWIDEIENFFKEYVDANIICYQSNSYKRQVVINNSVSKKSDTMFFDDKIFAVNGEYRTFDEDDAKFILKLLRAGKVANAVQYRIV